MARVLSSIGAVFVAGAATMALEILVPRRLAPWIGTSMPVWTASFAVVLLGLGLGSALGGWTADRLRGRSALGLVLLLAAAALAIAPYAGSGAAAAVQGLSPILRALAATAAAALLPTLLLGAVYPIVARRALEVTASPARVLGWLAAAGAAGSLAGTYLAAFVALPRFAVGMSFQGLAGLVGLAALATLMRPSSSRAPAEPGAASAIPTSAASTSTPTPPAPSLGDGTDAPPLSLAAVTALSALGGAATLALEVVAGRRTALYAGSSLEAWTSVLFVVLAGLTLGGLLGGLLGSRGTARSVLFRALVGCAVLAAATSVGARALPWAVSLPDVPFAARVALGVALAYSPALLALGTLAPILAKAALSDAATRGRRVGAVSASGTLGALVGTLATGPSLLPALRIEGATAAIGFAMAVAAFLVLPRRAWIRRTGASIVALACGLLLVVSRAELEPARKAGLEWGLRSDADGVWVHDGGYARIVVRPAPKSKSYGRPARVLLIDVREHGIQDIEDLSWIGSGYGSLYVAVTERVTPRSKPLRALFLGGGTYTAPRAILDRYPGSTVDVAEIDPDVTRAAREKLGLVDRPGLRIFHEDARAFVRSLPADAPRYDLVFADAFGDLAVPWHLTTIEFAREVRAHMTPHGIYLANTIDVFRFGRFTAAMHLTLSSVWPHVQTIGVRRGDDWAQNFVFVASEDVLDLEGLTRADPAAHGEGSRLAVVHYEDEEMKGLERRVGASVLTDDRAPVEDLLSPIVDMITGR